MPTRNDCDPAGRRLPIKLDSTTNGEFAPIPLDDSLRRANALAAERATEFAKRVGKSRREFLVSSCGAASTLLAFNAAHAAAGRTGGFFQLSADAALDSEIAAAELGKQEFIFDVQGHFVNPTGAWLKKLPAGARPISFAPKGKCKLADEPGARSYLRCLGSDEFVKDVFLDSDTDMMVLSFVPSARDAEPLTIEEATATRDIVERMQGSHRLLLHGRVNPNQPGDLEDMERLAKFGIVAWKTYTQFGPEDKGFFMTDDVGIAFCERATALGIRNIAIHKGLPFGPKSYEHSTCSDIGPIAKRFPDLNFLIYHSGFVAEGAPEGAYDASRTDGDRCARHLAPESRRGTEHKRVSGARFDLALPLDAQARRGGARARQALQVLRREQRALGHGFDLVRLAAGPDPGVPHVPDRARAARQVRISADHAAAAPEGVRVERRQALQPRHRHAEEERA